MTQGGQEQPRWEPGPPNPGEPPLPPGDLSASPPSPGGSASPTAAEPGPPSPSSGAGGPASPPPAPPPAPPERYPIDFDVAYPERLSRLSTFFRLPLLLVVAFVFYPLSTLLGGAAWFGWLSVFFRRKYPDWLFTAMSGGLAWTARAWAYATLQVDHFPSLEAAGHPVRLQFPSPPNGHLSRWRVLVWKAVLLIPHIIVIYFLALAVTVVVFIAWFAIMFTGRYPRGMFGFVTGVTRWYYRIVSYFLSFNDRFPPFAFSDEAGPASKATTVTCAIIGGIIAIGGTIGIAVAIAFASQPKEIEADYEALKLGIPSTTVDYLDFDDRSRGSIRIDRVYDPGDDRVPGITVDGTQRIIVFELTFRNRTMPAREITARVARLTYRDFFFGDKVTIDPELVLIDGRTAPRTVERGETVTITLVYVLARDDHPTALRWRPSWGSLGGIRFNFD